VVPAASSGIQFTNFIPAQRHLTNNILLNGSGLACGDVDGDGLVDLYLCRIDGPNVLYRNLGNWKFEDITKQAGVACDGLASTSTLLADIDGDGDLDLIVGTFGNGTHIFFNDGHGHFTPSPQGPINNHYGSASMALADIDGNGTLDLYIANYRTISLRDQPNTRFSVRTIDGRPQVVAVNGRPLTDPDLTNRFNFQFRLGNGTATFSDEENGEPDGIYLNDGKGRFTLLPFTGGAFLDESGRPLTAPPFDWGLSVTMRDLNGDGAPDIYVCNDFQSPDRIWMNNGKGQFRALPPMAIRQTSLFSMGIDVADVNRDGHFDIFVLDMLSRDHRRRMTQRADMGGGNIEQGPWDRLQSGRNTLQLARGDGTYAEVAQFAGVEASEWSWTPIFLDVDLDGYEDLLIANGFERDGMNVDVAAGIKAEKAARKMSPIEQLQLRIRYPRLDTPHAAYRNTGAGRFVDSGAAWNFNHLGVSQAMALADLDNDGDLDVILAGVNSPAMLLRNVSAAPRLAVRLKGNPPNTRGIGARIMVTAHPGSSSLPAQSQEIISGGRYLSSDDAMRVFAAGSLTNTFRIEVAWRTGRRSVVENATASAIYEIDESSAVTVTSPAAPAVLPLFEDVSVRLNHHHTDEPFDDFARQPLLPRKLSQLGPGVTWADVDGDGRDDLVIPSGRAGSLAVFHS